MTECKVPRPFDWEANACVTGSNKSLFCFIPARASSLRQEQTPGAGAEDCEAGAGAATWASGAELRWGAQRTRDSEFRIELHLACELWAVLFP